MSKFKKKAVSLVIIMMFLLQTGISLAQPQDVEGHWGQEQILKWLKRGWVDVGDDGRFYPDAKITRGEFIALTNKAFGFEKTTQVNFSDLPEDHKYAEEVAKAVAAGYISGFDDGTVHPDKYISRLEVTAILTKVAELPLPEDLTFLTAFTDYEDIPDWGKAFVGTVVDVGLMNGYPDGSFRPNEYITRVEAITILDSFLDNFYFLSEAITKPGYLSNNPSTADSGILKSIVVTYFLGEDFKEGTVIFYLPPGVTAVENHDAVVISDSSGKSETFKLEPLHIVNNGEEVHVTGINAEKGGVVILLLKDKDISEPGYYYFSVTADADGPGEKLSTEDYSFVTSELFSRISPEI